MNQSYRAKSTRGGGEREKPVRGDGNRLLINKPFKRRNQLGNENNTNQQVITPEELDALKKELEAEKGRSSSMVEEATKPLAERIASLEADIKVKARKWKHPGKLLWRRIPTSLRFRRRPGKQSKPTASSC